MVFLLYEYEYVELKIFLMTMFYCNNCISTLDFFYFEYFCWTHSKHHLSVKILVYNLIVILIVILILILILILAKFILCRVAATLSCM